METLQVKDETTSSRRPAVTTTEKPGAAKPGRAARLRESSRFRNSEIQPVTKHFGGLSTEN
jgi:hypothetical protein